MRAAAISRGTDECTRPAAFDSKVADVLALYDRYRGQPSLFAAQGPKCYDYIQSPKPDGYRGIHIVGRYRSEDEERAIWNGQRIESQLRSRLQHAFATAVETVTTFTSKPLKFGGGPPEWKRFFSLMGTAIAMREGTPPVPDTPTKHKELVAAVRGQANESPPNGLETASDLHRAS